MSERKSELTESARRSLEVLNDIARKIKDALAESDDYWTWAGFYNDKKNDFLSVKEKGEKAVQNLQDTVKSLRELDAGGEHEQIFKEIDDRKKEVDETVEALKQAANLKNLATNGEKLAELLEQLLDRFHETSQAVEKLLDRLNGNSSPG